MEKVIIRNSGEACEIPSLRLRAHFNRQVMYQKGEGSPIINLFSKHRNLRWEKQQSQSPK